MPIKLNHITSESTGFVGDYAVMPRELDNIPSPQHHHDDFDEIVIVTGGSALHVVDEDRYPLIRGDAFVVRGNHTHGYYNCERFRYTDILFHYERFDTIAEDLVDWPGFKELFFIEPRYRKNQSFKSKLHLDSHQLEYVLTLVRLMHAEINDNAPSSPAIVESFFRIIVTELSRCYAQMGSAHSRQLFKIASVINLFEHRYADHISIDDMANEAGMTRRTFHRAFKQTIGCAPLEYLLRLRVEKAAELLSAGDIKVSDAAMQTGFDDSAYFSRQFKAIMGVSPTAYARKEPHALPIVDGTGKVLDPQDTATQRRRRRKRTASTTKKRGKTTRKKTRAKAKKGDSARAGKTRAAKPH